MTQNIEKEEASLSLSAAGYKFKRLAALFDGRVKIEDCDAQF